VSSFGGEFGLVDPCIDLFAERVEGTFDRCLDGAKVGKYGGQTWTQDAVIGSCEKKGGAESEVGDAVTEAFGEAFDQAVEAQAAKLVG